MIDYTVIRSRRRTLALEVTRQGTALVPRPPAGLRCGYHPLCGQSPRLAGKTSGSTAGLSIRPPGAVCGTSGRMAAAGKRDTAAPGGPLGPAHGVQPTGITVTAARTRFGSCSGKNRLSFSLYLMAYPETAIEYVVVHELAHIRHHDHSPAFYREVEAYLPDWRARRALLRPVIPPFCAVHSILRRRPFNRAVVFL